MPEDQTEITLGVLSAVEENRNVTQRLVAKDLGVALGRETLFKKGQVVEIADGPMAETAAIFDRVDDNDRVTVLMDLMGRQVRVCVPLEAVRPAA